MSKTNKYIIDKYIYKIQKWVWDDPTPSRQQDYLNWWKALGSGPAEDLEVGEA